MNLERITSSPLAWCITGCLVVIGWTTCWNIEGADRYIRVHDTLDSNFTLLSVTATDEFLMARSNTRLTPFANVPRHCGYNELYLPIWLFRFFDPIVAYFITELLVRLVAFIGSFLLVQQFVWPPDANAVRLPFITAVACCFSFLPFWIVGGLEVPGHPILLWAILNLGLKKQTVAAFSVVVAIPLFSSLITTGFFVLPMIGVGFLLNLLIRRQISWRLIVACVILTAGWLASNYRLFEVRYGDFDFVSSRVEYTQSKDAQGNPILKHGYTSDLAMWEAKHAFFSGDDSHAPPKHTPVILLAVVVASVACLLAFWMRQIQHIKKQNWRIQQQRLSQAQRSQVESTDRESTETLQTGALMFTAVSGCLLTSVWAGWYRTPAVGALISSLGINALNEINFARFHWFGPLMWVVAFACAIRILSRLHNIIYIRPWMSVVIASGFVCWQLTHLTWESEYYDEKQKSGITFDEFYSPEVFNEIRNTIDRDQSTYRVASVGLHPTIAQQNGFHTIDGYIASYELSHKQALRRVIAKELEKNEFLKAKFDDWGARFYLFSAELIGQSSEERASGSFYMYYKNDTIRSIGQFDINVAELRKMGAEYIFSAVEIENANELELEMVGEFTTDESPWRITVYRLPDFQTPEDTSPNN